MTQSMSGLAQLKAKVVRIVEAIPEGEITPTPSAWRIRPPGQPSRADFFGMLDRINGDRRLDDKEE